MGWYNPSYLRAPVPTQAWRQGGDPCTLDRWCGVSCWSQMRDGWRFLGRWKTGHHDDGWFFWCFFYSFFSTCLILCICVCIICLYIYFYFFIYWIILTYVLCFFWNYVDTASTTLLLGCHGVTKKSWLHPQAWSLFQAPRLMSCVYLYIYACNAYNAYMFACVYVIWFFVVFCAKWSPKHGVVCGELQLCVWHTWCSTNMEFSMSMFLGG